MKRIFMPLVMTVATALLCASCLGSSEEEYTYYDDTAVTAFTLGTLNRYTTVAKSDGTDSIAKTTVTGSSYKFYIDQQQRLIYNPDSLPVGTDVEKVVCTISAKNGGTVLLKHPEKDSVAYYTATDSIDFSRPRTIIVYSQSGKTFRQYVVSVNVHQQEADDMAWDARSADEGQAAWQQYGLPLLSLVPDWSGETLDSDPALLPTEDVSACRFTLGTNADVERIVVVGNRSLDDYPDDSLAVVWGKLVETGANSHDHLWTFYNTTGNRFPLPRMKSLAVACYDGNLLATGLLSDGTVSDFYVSRDGGNVWRKESTYPLPDDINDTAATGVKLFTDDDNYLWIVLDDNRVWRGRINRLGWADAGQ